MEEYNLPDVCSHFNIHRQEAYSDDININIEPMLCDLASELLIPIESMSLFLERCVSSEDPSPVI